MSHYNMLLSRAAYDIVRSDLADTATHPGLFETWQDKLNTYAAAESVIDLYLQQGDYTTAMNKVDSLQINFVFSSYDSVEYPYYQNLKTLQAGWLGQGRNIFDLTSSEISSLSAIADSSRGIAGAQARGILAFAYDSAYAYVNCAQMPDTSQKSVRLGSGSDKHGKSLSITVKPNPATDRVIFTYSLPEGIENGKLMLYNPSGRLLDRLDLTKAQGEIQYNCSHLEPGFYFYSVSCAGELKSGKLVIVR
ncbi:MAG: T9SS type A sorting domain-containing protein [Bacteroidales bacterium]|nr:T9SS type A sorting domain-containing protein [Bacteroidales bacterium]